MNIIKLVAFWIFTISVDNDAIERHRNILFLNTTCFFLEFLLKNQKDGIRTCFCLVITVEILPKLKILQKLKIKCQRKSQSGIPQKLFYAKINVIRTTIWSYRNDVIFWILCIDQKMRSFVMIFIQQKTKNLVSRWVGRL